MIDNLTFLSEAQVRDIAKDGTPVFVYSKEKLKQNVNVALAFKSSYGLTVRYAMKANPNAAILKIFNSLGIQIDASSGGEAEKALAAGFEPGKIQITSQQLPDNLDKLLKKGVRFNATSLHQLDVYGSLAPNSDVGVRINPGYGDGLNNRLTTGGVAASFGIWHEYIDEVHKIASKHNLKIRLLHTHAGTGTDPEGWLKVANRNLELLERFPDATHTSLGGGFKVARMSDEKSTDLGEVSELIDQSINEFCKKTGRKIHIEIEPGNFLTTNAGTLISQIVDKKDTGEKGYKFLIINAGMTEILRPSLYGAQHPLIVVPQAPSDIQKTEDYVVSGHCCESGDVLTVAPGDPETLKPRSLKYAKIGDFLCVEGVGSYCASMSANMYNSFPLAREIIVE